MKATVQIPRREYYAESDGWDGRCWRCGHDYFTCRGNCTCLSCNAQRQKEVEASLVFPEDEEDEARAERAKRRMLRWST